MLDVVFPRVGMSASTASYKKIAQFTIASFAKRIAGLPAAWGAASGRRKNWDYGAIGIRPNLFD